jgi:hypothetical protein
MTRTRSVVLAGFLLLCVPGTAHAERHPTPKEKTAIEKAARKASADQFFRVSVSRVEVSTVERRWATAAVALFRRKEPHAPASQRIQETFYRTRQGWVAGLDVAMPDVEMPIDVQRDLGFAGPAPLFGISGEAAVWVILGVIALILLSVAGAASRDSGGGGSKPVPVSTGGRAKPQAFEPERKCGTCGGSGTIPPPQCSSCGGTGRIRNPNPDLGVPYVNCYACGGPQQPRQCPSCHGTGKA